MSVPGGARCATALLSAVALGGCGCFAGTPQPGFFDLVDGLPPAVTASARSIVRLVPLDRDARPVPERAYSRFLRRMERGHEEGRVGTAQLHVVRLLVAEASRSGQPWARLATAGDASGFVVGDQRTLVTARHCFVRPDEEGPLRHVPVLPAGMRLHFVLFDHEDRIVFDTRRRDMSAIVAACGDPSTAHESGQPALREAATDYLVIRLNRSIDVAPLALFEQPAVARPVFIPGFPERTYDRSRLGVPDADGVSMVCSRGILLPGPMHSTTYYGAELICDDVGFREMLLHTTADGAPGLSGSPILDGSGRVVGVFAFTTTLGDHHLAHGVPGNRLAAALRALGLPTRSRGRLVVP